MFIEKMTKIAKNFEKWEIFEFLLFRGSFWIIMGIFWSFPKKSKNPLSTYHTKLNLCELSSMGNTLKVEYKFRAWQIL